ncbi:hypothetical protein VL15_05680 [Burkholderia cepacia]|uniref:Uncharacterized protein n=1 Tax=Burkholderia cepacia TaxID=292 RepID=A0A0J5X945_BURCE|nr:hypothetical protein VL15_05680 [Burkholderia cepacia]
MLGATPFLGYTIEPAGCSRYCDPGALALLRINRLGGGSAIINVSQHLRSQHGGDAPTTVRRRLSGCE